MSSTPKIVRRPDRAEGGITEAEKVAMDAHAQKWIANAMRTGRTNQNALTQAIKDLYAAAGLKEPRVVIVPSPRIMAFAGGFAATIWWRRKNSATYLATESATDLATDSATDLATDSATYSATRSATALATESATYLATESATDLATYSATRSATALATRSATDLATDSATYSATRSATDLATRSATHLATDLATYLATESATYLATRSATALATDLATDLATRSATALATASANAISFWKKIAIEILGPDWGIGLSCAARWSLNYQGGNMWSAWDCYLTAARDILGLRLPIHEKSSAWERCAQLGGFRWMHTEFCMVSDFPDILTVDEQNRPHNATGPSHRWSDGWEIHHWHGVMVPAFVIEAPETITIQHINAESNAEVRRVMIERLGWDHYLAESGAKPIATDTFGELFEVGEQRRVRVRNSTAEPDGSFKHYIFTVSRTCSTPKEGIARAYGRKVEDYRPAVET